MEKYKWSSNGRFIGIIRLSAKGTDGVMTVSYTHLTLPTIRLV